MKLSFKEILREVFLSTSRRFPIIPHDNHSFFFDCELGPIARDFFHNLPHRSLMERHEEADKL